ncbi:MAG: hypothetical protein RLY67_445 [Pseudomonadota bacterium]
MNRARTASSWITGEGRLVILRDALLSAAEAETLGCRLKESDATDPSLPAAESDMLLRLTQAPVNYWKTAPDCAPMVELAWIEESISSQVPDFFAFNEGGHLPWGAISALGDGLIPKDGESWAPLQLAKLQMSPQQVGLSFAADYLEIGPSYLNAIEETIHAQGVRIERARSGRYYLVANRRMDLAAAHPRCLMNAHLPDYPVVGSDAAWWRRLSNDIQMTWDQVTPENGDPLAGGATMVWAWGWGALKTGGRAPLAINPTSATGQLEEAPLEPWIPGLQALLGSIGLSPRIKTRAIALEPSLHPIDAWSAEWRDTLADLAKGEIDTLLLVDAWDSLVVTPTRSTHLRDRLRRLLGKRLPGLSAWPSHLVMPGNTRLQDA